jgi:beta-xylosidase
LKRINMNLTYQNPVWSGYLADPFVLKTGGDYYAYGTGSSVGDDLSNGRMFPVLHSKDLAHWEFVGGALQPLSDFASTAYWAPEVAERDGKFYMYYSAATGAGDEGRQGKVRRSSSAG